LNSKALILVTETVADIQYLFPTRQESLYTDGIEMTAGAVAQEPCRALQLPGLLVRALAGQRIKHVGNRAYPGPQRDVLTADAVRITAAVEFFVVAEGDLRR